jgi:hypothetical protein
VYSQADNNEPKDGHDLPRIPSLQGTQVSDEGLKDWIQKALHLLDKKTQNETEKFMDIFDREKSNRRLLRKVILLVGEFAADEQGNKHVSTNAWVNDNSTRFGKTYLEALQVMIEKNESEFEKDEVRRNMVKLGLPRIIIVLISKSASLKLTEATISLANSLMEGGFYPAQSAFRKRLIELGNNDFLSKIRDIIRMRLPVKTNLEIQETQAPKFPPPRYGSWGLITRVSEIDIFVFRFLFFFVFCFFAVFMFLSDLDAPAYRPSASHNCCAKVITWSGSNTLTCRSLETRLQIQTNPRARRVKRATQACRST